ncbi:MAG: oligoendopeptidase F [Firmicutes bacterium]|nr:oligoendopeptidase F [Bacillota bacterium]
MEYKTRAEVPNEYKWDLSKMYKENNEIEKDIDKVNELTPKILEFKSHIMDSSDSLYNFLKTTEEQDRIITKLYVYSKMAFDVDTKDNKTKALKMKIEKLNEGLSEQFSFIEPEMMESDYETVLKYISENKKLKEYRFYLEDIYRFKPHSLSQKEEDIYVRALNAFGNCSETFNNINNADIDLGYIKNENGEDVKLTQSNYFVFMKSKDRSVRENAFNAMYNYFKNRKNTLASTYVGEIKESSFVTNVKKYNSTLERSLFNDNIDVSVYKNLIDTVHKNLDLMYDYMELRKKMLNLEKLHMYDIYVDLVKCDKDNIPFEEGKKILFEALKPLGEKYLNDLNKAFDEKWIDIYPGEGKRSGAYSWGCYDSYPYLLLNYNDTVDAVSTMGHELGHSMHSYYSKSQNYVDSNYPIFLAEIASTVNEVLINDYMYKNAKTKEEKIFYLVDFLDTVRTTLYRQTMFAEFEMIMHQKEQDGIPLTEEEISNTYYELNKLYYGDNVVSDDNIRYEWSRIPHFYTPFYVYKYATGLSAALSIASRILKGDTETRDNYLVFLSSGGNDYPLNILKKVGVDMETPKPIEEALSLFEEKQKILKKLIK